MSVIKDVVKKELQGLGANEECYGIIKDKSADGTTVDVMITDSTSAGVGTLVGVSTQYLGTSSGIVGANLNRGDRVTVKFLGRQKTIPVVVGTINKTGTAAMLNDTQMTGDAANPLSSYKFAAGIPDTGNSTYDADAVEAKIQSILGGL